MNHLDKSIYLATLSCLGEMRWVNLGWYQIDPNSTIVCLARNWDIDNIL
jgi:hypothetical protein